MAQFDLYRRPDDGFWVDCQTDFMAHYETRFVVPIMPLTLAPRPTAPRLNPQIEIASRPHVLLTQFAGSIPEAELGDAVGSLVRERYAILNALDFLITGV